MSTELPVCPSCNGSEHTQKVSSIVHNQTYRMSWPRDVTTTSLLAQKLALPPENIRKEQLASYLPLPTAPKSSIWQWFLWIPLTSLPLCWGISFFSQQENPLIAYGIFPFFIMWVLVLNYIAKIVYRFFPKEREYEQQMRVYQQQMQDRQHMIEQKSVEAEQKWNTLYYCSRCDGIFTGSSEFYSINQLNTVLYF